jgi:hypothetical protein
MIKHIVMWTLKEEAHGLNREQLAQKIKADLEALPPHIPELKEIEVGVNVIPGDAACDLCLISVFDSWEGLETYRVHPAHQQVVAFVKDAVTSRHVVDYET